MSLTPRHEEHEERREPPKAEPKPDAKANGKKPAQRDAAADQLALLLMLASDWLNGDRSHAGQIQALVTSLTPKTPPSNVDAPHISQDGTTLHCTMGNWTNVPTGYAYQWTLDGGNVGTDAADYAVQPEDVGKTALCLVTATNEAGSTVGPVSNALVVA